VLDQGFEDKVKSQGTNPDLTFVNTANALAQRLKGLGTRKHTADSRTKSFDNQVAVEVIQQNYDANFGVGTSELIDEMDALDGVARERAAQ
jgi:hypothetical protein